MTKKSTVTAIIAATSMLALAGCSGFDDPGSAKADTDLVVALGVEPVSMDPCDSQTADNGVILRGNISEALTQIDPVSGEVIPELAESWTQEDPETWIFTLREGVTFHDGTPFNAEAVVTSMSRILNPDLICSNYDQFPDPPTFTALDEFTVQVETQGEDPILPLRMSFGDVTAPSTPADEKTTSPIATGPYKFVERIQGESVTIERYDDYWGDTPQVTSVKYVYRTEPSVRAGMVTAGEADIATRISPQHATDDDRTGEFSDNRVLWLRTLTDRPPFDDIRVRKAVHHAIDKETIVGTLMVRAGKPTDQLFTSSVNAYIPDYEGADYDPDKARDLIADAAADGVAVETEFDLVTRPDLIAGGDEIMQAIVQNLEDVGFNVTIQSVETDAWLKLLRQPFPADQKPTLLGISHDNVTGDASFSYPKYIASDGANSSIKDPVIDDLLAQAATAQGDERASLYQQASLRQYEDVAAMIPIAELTSLILLGEGVEYEVNPLSNNSMRISAIEIN